MGRKKKAIPSYRRHKQSGQAIVTLTDSTTGKRRDVLLGPYDSEASRTEYAEVLRRWENSGRVVDGRTAPTRSGGPRRGEVTVGHVAVAFMESETARYAGRRSQNQLAQIRSALRVLRSQFGSLAIHDFGPLALGRLRAEMLRMGWARKVVNARIRIVVSAFRHGVATEMVPAEKLAALEAVRPLRRGEGGHEGQRVLPVPDADINAVRPHVSPQVWAMVELQRLTGMRAGEVVIVRSVDIDTAGNVWLYRPAWHKRDDDEHHERIVFMGPQAQQIVQPFMRGRAVDAYLFSPREGNATRAAGRAAGKRRANQKPTPTDSDRKIGDRYTVDSYRRAIERACEAAGIDRWTPGRLRHTAATTLRREAGLEAASVILGHSTPAITDAVYAERDLEAASRVIGKIG